MVLELVSYYFLFTIIRYINNTLTKPARTFVYNRINVG